MTITDFQKPSSVNTELFSLPALSLRIWNCEWRHGDYRISWFKQCRANHRQVSVLRGAHHDIPWPQGEISKAVPGLNKISIDLCKIQPSQFYVSREKVNAMEEFINRETDVIIPIKEYRDRRISLDGHTRLYIAKQKGFAKVPGFFAETDDHIYRFVKEAVRRGIKSVPDLKLVSPEEYEILFCGEFFQNIKSSQKTLTY